MAAVHDSSAPEPVKEISETNTTKQEKQNLIVEDKEKCCPHVYLVVFKCVMVLFVIPALIVASILLWLVWLILLPTTVFCPCCDLCAAVVRILWKILSKIPVYLMDWVCGRERDDDRYQVARKRRRKMRSHKRHRSYNTMETQTEMTPLDDVPDEDRFAENPDGHTSDSNGESQSRGFPRDDFEVDLLVGAKERDLEAVHGQGPPYGDLGPLVEDEEAEEDLMYLE